MQRDGLCDSSQVRGGWRYLEHTRIETQQEKNTHTSHVHHKNKRFTFSILKADDIMPIHAMLAGARAISPFHRISLGPSGVDTDQGLDLKPEMVLWSFQWQEMVPNANETALPVHEDLGTVPQ